MTSASNENGPRSIAAILGEQLAVIGTLVAFVGLISTDAYGEVQWPDQ